MAFYFSSQEEDERFTQLQEYAYQLHAALNKVNNEKKVGIILGCLLPIHQHL